MKIYLDNAATTKVDNKVLKAMLPYLKEEYGNPSSAHSLGEESKKAIEKSRKIIAGKINVKPSEIYFTSGGTEANNWALKGLFFENFPKKNHIITTKIEHDSILKTCEWLEKQGAKVTYLDVDKEGFIDLDKLKKTINKRTFLVSIIHGNNEIGTIQDIEKIGKLCKEKDVLFHTDACQSFTKLPTDVKKMNLDLMTLNAHKIHGPKGIGALFIKNRVKITPLLHGGGHEKGKRSGTENVSGIVGFSKAVEISNKKDYETIRKLRDKLIKDILEKIPNSKLNGPMGEKRLSNNINISFKDIEGESLGRFLENQGIFVSTGSACMSNTHSGSHVLKAIGLNQKQSNSSIRISLSKYAKEKNLNYLMKKLPEIINKLRKVRVK